MGQRGGERVMRFAVLLALAAGAADAACPPREIVELETATGVVAFGVEIAETPDQRARGLMFRTEMARDRGMLFLFPDAAPRTFWMKDTPLSLDMLFMAPDGVVCGIVREATPLSLDPRPSGCDASVVLEINGGLSDELGLDVGARVRSVVFGEDAAWPCEIARPPDRR
jgi:uncharacterized membrane protein (UPF0127 family)